MDYVDFCHLCGLLRMKNSNVLYFYIIEVLLQHLAIHWSLCCCTRPSQPTRGHSFTPQDPPPGTPLLRPCISTNTLSPYKILDDTNSYYLELCYCNPFVHFLGTYGVGCRQKNKKKRVFSYFCLYPVKIKNWAPKQIAYYCITFYFSSNDVLNK